MPSSGQPLCIMHSCQPMLLHQPPPAALPLVVRLQHALQRALIRRQQQRRLPALVVLAAMMIAMAPMMMLRGRLCCRDRAMSSHCVSFSMCEA